MCWNEQQDAGGCTGLDRLLLCLLCVHDNVPQAMVWGQSCPQSCPRSWHLFSWGRLARRAALRSPSLQATKGQMTKHHGLLYCSYLCCFGVPYMLIHERIQESKRDDAHRGHGSLSPTGDHERGLECGRASRWQIFLRIFVLN